MASSAAAICRSSSSLAAFRSSSAFSCGSLASSGLPWRSSSSAFHCLLSAGFRRSAASGAASSAALRASRAANSAFVCWLASSFPLTIFGSKPLRRALSASSAVGLLGGVVVHLRLGVDGLGDLGLRGLERGHAIGRGRAERRGEVLQFLRVPALIGTHRLRTAPLRKLRDGLAHLRDEPRTARHGVGPFDAILLLGRQGRDERRRICLKTRTDLAAEVGLLAGEFLAAVEDLPAAAGPARQAHFGERLGVDDELLVGGGIEVGRGLVEVLDHVELDEHAAQFGDDLALLREGGLLLGAGLGRVLGGLGDGGGFEVIEDLLDLVVREPAQALRDLFEHLPLGRRRERWKVMASMVEPARRAASSIRAWIFFCSSRCLAGSRSWEAARGTIAPTSSAAAR